MTKDTLSSWVPCHTDETFFSTTTNITDNEKAMLEELVKWKDNRVYKSVDYNNQKLNIVKVGPFFQSCKW